MWAMTKFVGRAIEREKIHAALTARDKTTGRANSKGDGQVGTVIDRYARGTGLRREGRHGTLRILPS
jgi:hypothetical protein